MGKKRNNRKKSNRNEETNLLKMLFENTSTVKATEDISLPSGPSKY